MESIDNIQQFQIYVEALSASTGYWDFVYDDRSVNGFPEYDFYIPIFLKRTNELYEYVQVDIEKDIKPIIRQEVNPFFMELSFFNGIDQNKILYGSDLTIDVINYIKNVRPELIESSDSEIIIWFDQIGINEFPWNPGTSSETTLDDLDKINLSSNHIISKANYFGIDIYK